MITPENIVRHELIGLEARVESSKDPGAPGTSGRVIDETRNMLKLETAGGKEKSFAKEQCVFSFVVPGTGERVRVDGKILVARPEDRVKKRFDRW